MTGASVSACGQRAIQMEVFVTWAEAAEAGGNQEHKRIYRPPNTVSIDLVTSTNPFNHLFQQLLYSKPIAVDSNLPTSRDILLSASLMTYLISSTGSA